MQLATYREVRHDTKLVYELYEDSISIVGTKTFETDFETTIPLVRIYPAVSRLRQRHRTFWAGAWVAVIGFIVYGMLIHSFGYDPIAEGPGICFGIGVMGIAMSLATLKKVEFARFDSDAGVAILDIARSGPDSEHFVAFVNQVLEQVRIARDAATQGKQNTG
jgi:hypothetical protein